MYLHYSEHPCAMLKLKATFNEGANVVDGIGKQLPFAIARTLTKTAQEGQAEGRKEAGSVFKLRNDWTTRNVKITPATKANQQAEVYTDTANRATGAPDYLVGQEDGKERVPVNGRQHIAIPTKYLRQFVGDKPIPDWLRPKAMLAYAARNGNYVNRKGKVMRGRAGTREYFFFKVQFKSGAYGIMARAVGDAREAALPMYILVISAHIRKRFHLQEDVQRAVDNNLQRHWDEVLKEIAPLKI